MTSAADTGDQPGTRRRRGGLQLRRRAGACWRVVRLTFQICLRHRVTGLAAEAGFFGLLSLPPLFLGLVATLGYLKGPLGAARVNDVENWILNSSRTFVSQRGVDEVVAPILHTVLKGGRADIISISFLIALWSGSRALNVYVDTITIAYGLSGIRGIMRTRLLAFGLYLVGLVVGALILPMLVVGPRLVDDALPSATGVFHALYWPVLLLACIFFLNTLYHMAVPVKTPWLEHLPGTVLALMVWVGGSALLRLYLESTVEGPTVYGSLAAPVAVLLWLYVTALAVLIGAAVNAAVDQLWPHPAVEEEGVALRRFVPIQQQPRTRRPRSRALVRR